MICYAADATANLGGRFFNETNDPKRKDNQVILQMHANMALATLTITYGTT